MKIHELLDWIHDIIRGTTVPETRLYSCGTSAQGRRMPLEKSFAAEGLHRFLIRRPIWKAVDESVRMYHPDPHPPTKKHGNSEA